MEKIAQAIVAAAGLPGLSIFVSVMFSMTRDAEVQFWLAMGSIGGWLVLTGALIDIVGPGEKEQPK